MPEAQRLYLLKLVPRILIQTCCLSTSSILARVSIYKNNVRRRGRGVTISLLLQFQQGLGGRDRVRNSKLPRRMLLSPTPASWQDARQASETLSLE